MGRPGSEIHQSRTKYSTLFFQSFPSFPNPRILDDEGSDLRREDAVDYVIDGPDDDCHCARAYNLIRMVIQHSSRGERAYDVFSGLLEDRIICINGPISDNTFHVFFAQLLFSSSPRTLLSVSICTSIRLVAVSPQAAASMISLLLAAGATVHRRSRPNPTIMIHQPSGGYSGQGVRETIVSASVAKGLKTEPSYHMAKRWMPNKGGKIRLLTCFCFHLYVKIISVYFTDNYIKYACTTYKKKHIMCKMKCVALIVWLKLGLFVTLEKF
ncbi:PREDICTED: ATP-dependent Clp protease proteolytic subunit-like isoform X3 [Tarenaya hassleriana]|uniref:ATP-dependent Clp protease proteolytic subunit-like isoform X3 n=1 Tax=Tarenaya hassleriana TaxID=28532 RepID=UPI00053C4620|nr:PREDICTED: ATP-dependent Clp protease proteolytic subunit-like isoform X3 [Tarenaya hassleriana]